MFMGSGFAFGAIPTQIIIALVLTAATAWMLKHTRMGRELYVVGANPSAAKFSGLKAESWALSFRERWRLLRESFISGGSARRRRRSETSSIFSASAPWPSEASPLRAAQEAHGAL